METKINKYSKFSKLLLLILLAASFVWIESISPSSVHPANVKAAGPQLLYQSDFTYVGAFKLPGDPYGMPNGIFDYSNASTGGAVYNDPVNGKSLFITGYLSAGYVSTTPSLAQVKIPSTIRDPDAPGVGDAGLATATVVQGFADPSNGKGAQALTSEGTLNTIIYNGKLIGTEETAYDANCSQTKSAWVSPINFNQSSQATGPYAFNSPAGARWLGGGFMALIPPEWQSAFGGKVVSGGTPLSIISCAPAGPSLHVIDADALTAQPAASTVIASKPLVYYENGDHSCLGQWDSNLPTQIVCGRQVPNITITDPHGRGNFTIPYFENTSNIHGVLFADGTRSVIFFGRKGLGRYCYGEGTADLSLNGKPVPGFNGEVLYCYDPQDSGKGDHAYPYTEFAWAYDINDLLLVKNGSKNPWDIYPYTGWAFKAFGDGTGGSQVGMAWDPATRLAYMTVSCSTGQCDPIVHVFSVGIPGGTPPFNFTMSNAGARTVNQGSSSTNTITSTLSSGTTQAVSFTASGLPTAATASFSPTSCNPSCSTTMTVNTTSSTPVGAATITVTGSSGSTVQTTSFVLTVIDTTPPTVSISSPAAGATVSGTGVFITANASDNVGVAGVQFKLDGVNLGPEDTTAPYSIIWDTTTATNGSHTITALARDTSNNTATSSPVAVTVSNGLPPSFDFSMSNTGAVTVSVGSSSTNTITSTLSSGTAAAVSFTASGLPTGAAASFSPTSCNPSCSTTMTVNTTSSTPIGTSSITVTGTAGSLTHTTTFNLIVTGLTVPTVTSFTATPATISSGTSSILAWTTANATSVNISPAVGTVVLSGSQSVSPASTTTYTLTATSSSGTATSTVVVTVSSVNPPPPPPPGPTPTPPPGPTPPPTPPPGDRYPTGLIFKYPGNPTVYIKDGSIVHPITDFTVFRNQVPGSRPIATLPATVTFTNGSNLGLRSGTLIKSSDNPTVYLMVGSSKRAFASAAEFTSNGYRFNQVYVINDPPLVNSIPATTDAFVRPFGSLVKYASSPAVYFINPIRQKRGYSTLQMFNLWNGSIRDVITIPDSETYPDGPLALLPSGTLVKGSGPTIYLVFDTTLRPFTTQQLFTDFGFRFDQVVTVPDPDLNLHSIGDVMK